MLKFLPLSAAALLLIAGPALAAPDDPPAPAEKPARASNSVPSGLMRYDTNKDGVVDRAEWKAAQEARFKRLDTNGDGKLTEDELFARTPAIGNSVLPPDRQAQRQSSYFQLLDADKDGVVTLGRVHGPGRPQLRALRHQQGRPHRHRRVPPGAAAPAGGALIPGPLAPPPSYGEAGGGSHAASAET